MCEELILSGADIVKVGVGQALLCATRVGTGVGALSMGCGNRICRCGARSGRMIVSDGGCTTPGDVAKSLGGGADFVMLGSMLAGHEGRRWRR
ncbi:IMP dehydrogenase [Escherichia coli]